jgi:hypothetical protein
MELNYLELNSVGKTRNPDAECASATSILLGFFRKCFICFSTFYNKHEKNKKYRIFWF